MKAMCQTNQNMEVNDIKNECSHYFDIKIITMHHLFVNFLYVPLIECESFTFSVTVLLS